MAGHQQVRGLVENKLFFFFNCLPIGIWFWFYIGVDFPSILHIVVFDVILLVSVNYGFLLVLNA